MKGARITSTVNMKDGLRVWIASGYLKLLVGSSEVFEGVALSVGYRLHLEGRGYLPDFYSLAGARPPTFTHDERNATLSP